MFESGFLGGDCEGDRALNHVRIERRTIIGSLDVFQRVGDPLDIAHVGDCELGAIRLEPRAAGVLSVHQGADGITGFQ
jgi:hypothetical protein